MNDFIDAIMSPTSDNSVCEMCVARQEVIAALTVENRELRAALELYASSDNWRQKDTRTGAFDWFLRGNAGWDIADAALAKARGEP
jgi:hypothetical protein